MADLSAYQEISVELDYVNNVIKVTDPNNYPAGVDVDLIGILNITQPDGVQRTGDFNSPDIYYDSGGLVVAEIPLRLDSDGNPQQGTYTVEYQIDHPGYVPSTFTRTFDLAYTRKTLDLEEDFDVFTPSLFYRDNTNFSQTGWTTTTSTVAWAAQIGTVGSTSGATNNFDLVYSGDYYDAEYDIDYTRDLLYTHSTYSWLTLRDQYEENILTTADTPPTVNDIIQCLNDLKAELDAAAGSCLRTDLLEAKYQKAMVRYDHLIHKLRIGDGDDAEDLLEEILNLTSCSHGTNRNQPIDPYDLSAYTGGSGTGYPPYNYTVPADATEVTLAALNGKVITEIDLDGIGRIFSNGADGDTPDDGRFIVVTGSTPRKFKYGGTLYENQWLRIKYTD